MVDVEAVPPKLPLGGLNLAMEAQLLRSERNGSSLKIINRGKVCYS